MNDPRSTVLVVDDDPKILLGIRVALETDGHRVVTAADGRAALAAVVEHDPDAIVLDLTMPLLDGIGVCTALRAAADPVPIIMLTARDRSAQRIEGLDAGADDYLGKPFDVGELRARVRALLRRRHAAEAPALVWRGLRLDVARQTVAADPVSGPGPGPGSVPTILTRTETVAAELLFAQPGRVRTRDELASAIWGDEPVPSSNALDVAISGLRRKLSEAAGHPAELRAVRGLGYRLEP